MRSECTFFHRDRRTSEETPCLPGWVYCFQIGEAFKLGFSGLPDPRRRAYLIRKRTRLEVHPLFALRASCGLGAERYVLQSLRARHIPGTIELFDLRGQDIAWLMGMRGFNGQPVTLRAYGFPRLTPESATARRERRGW